jgi:hypothetical protein
MSETHDDSAEKEVARLQRENGVLRSQLAEALKDTVRMDWLDVAVPTGLFRETLDSFDGASRWDSSVRALVDWAQSRSARSTPKRGDPEGV